MLWGIFEGCVYFGGGFPCVGEFDVVVCGGMFDRVCIHLAIVDTLYDMTECLRDLYVVCGV